MRVEWSLQAAEMKKPTVLTSGDLWGLYFYLGDGSALTVWGKLPELREWLRHGLGEIDAKIGQCRVVHSDGELEKHNEGVDSPGEVGYIGPRAG